MRVWVLGAVASMAFACGDSEHRLVVDLISDFAPAYEAVAAVVTVDGEDHLKLLEADDRLFTPGVRIADIRLESGTYRVRVSLRGAGLTLGERSYLVEVTSDTAITAILTRDCAGVSCPAAGDSPDAQACLGGTCVPEQCLSATQPGCEVLSGCDQDAQCSGGSECTTARCVEGVCLVELDSEQCMSDEYCRADGCQSRPTELSDAGLDAGMDAGMDAGPDANVDATTDAPDTSSDAPIDTPDPRDGWVEIAGGELSSCARHSDGTVWCWGSNADGMLGDGTGSSSPIPVQVVGISSAVSLDCRNRHCCAVDGENLRCWGDNGSNQLPGATGPRAQIPVEWDTFLRVGKVSAGSTHICVLMLGAPFGATWCFGDNGMDQLSESGPGQVLGMGPSSLDVAAGFDHTCTLQDRVYCWGTGDRNQIGRGSTMGSATPVMHFDIDIGQVELAAGNGFTLARYDSGEVRYWGTLNGAATTPQPTGVNDAIAIAAGDDHACAVRMNGDVMCWGENDDGEVTGSDLDPMTIIPPTRVNGLPPAVDIGLGGNHSCAITADGEAWCWGQDADQQLGDGPGIGGPPPRLWPGDWLFGRPHFAFVVCGPNEELPSRLGSSPLGMWRLQLL